MQRHGATCVTTPPTSGLAFRLFSEIQSQLAANIERLRTTDVKVTLFLTPDGQFRVSGF
jgi:hypothetical protein